MRMKDVFVILDRESFELFKDRKRSQSFSGAYQSGQSVVVQCDDEQVPAIINRAGRNSWVAKPA